MSLIGDASLIVANSKIRRNHTLGADKKPEPVREESEPADSDEVKSDIAGLLRSLDEDAIREAGFPSWREYWRAGLAWDMPASDFVYLIETHGLTPERAAMEIKGTSVPFAMFIMKALDEALSSRETWIYGDQKAEKCRVNPREAVVYLNRRLGGQARLPETLQVYLCDDPGTGAPGRPSSMYLVEAEAERRRNACETVNRVSAEAKILEKWLKDNHPGSPPTTAKTIENRIRGKHPRK